MSNLMVQLENAKRTFDWQDLIDLLDDFVRESEKMEKKLGEREKDIGEYITQLDIKNKEINRLNAVILALESRIPHQVDERG